MPHESRLAMRWQLYIIRCTDGSLYTGITTDIERRLAQHTSGRGAKYFRGRKPEQLVYLERNHTRSSAARREREIKRLKSAQKEQLVSTAQNELLKSRFIE